MLCMSALSLPSISFSLTDCIEYYVRRGRNCVLNCDGLCGSSGGGGGKKGRISDQCQSRFLKLVLQ